MAIVQTAARERCPKCNGTGHTWTEVDSPPPEPEEAAVFNALGMKGSGWDFKKENKCSKCGGRGWVKKLHSAGQGVKMKKQTFNLKTHLQKQANYEGVQGYFQQQTRAWQNCCRDKRMAGSSAHEAWDSCLEEYQKTGNNLKWMSKHVVEDSIDRQKNVMKLAQAAGAQLQMGLYWDRVQEFKKKGMTTAQAVMAALNAAREDAAKIHVSDIE